MDCLVENAAPIEQAAYLQRLSSSDFIKQSPYPFLHSLVLVMGGYDDSSSLDRDTEHLNAIKNIGQFLGCQINDG